MKRLMDFAFKRGQVAGFLTIAALIVLVSTLAGFFPLWVNVPVNVLLPLYILLTGKMVMFEKLKLSTLIIMRTLIVFVLFNLMSGTLYIKIVLIFLIINILEATFTDLLKNKMYFNFVTGLALAGSVFFLGSEWLSHVTGPFSGLYLTYVTKAGEGIFALNDPKILASIAWIIAYTLWNWIFVMGEFSPSIVFHHIAILGSPLITCLTFWNPGYWLLMRANSLTFGGVLQISCKEELEKNLHNKKIIKFVNDFKKKTPQLICMIVNLALLAYSGYVYFVR